MSSKKREEALKELDAQKAVIVSQLNILARQGAIIAEYSKTLSGKDTSSAQLEGFLDVYGARQAKLNERRTSLNDQLAVIEKEIDDKSVSLNVDEQSVLLRGVRLTIVVLAEGDGEAELSLTYLVSQAWWNPQYDLRADIASDSKSDSTVTVHYRASISQKTGEDWDGVALTLSTASPLLGTDIPKLTPVWISERSKTQNFARRPRKSAAIPMPRYRMQVSSEDEMDLTEPPPIIVAASGPGSYYGGFSANAPSQPPNFFPVQGTTATEGAMSTTFSIPGLSSIPSDSQDSQQTHKVSIAELKFTSGIELEWIAVPKEVASAFLRCKVKNTMQYLMLPGQANVFLNGNFVAKSQIPHVSPQESFACSLGVDPAIRITYHPQTKKVRTSGGSVLSSFSAKTKTTTFEQSISVKNTRLSKVHRLLLKDQIPIASQADLKVTLFEPSGMVPSGKGNNGKNCVHTLSEGIQVHWAPKKDSDVPEEELSMDQAQGILEWIIEMAPGSNVDVKLSWEVVAPVDFDWS